MAAFTEWVVSIDGSGNSVPASEVSADAITGWFEGYTMTPSGDVDSGITGVLSVVDGLEDVIEEAAAIGNDPNTPLIDYKVHPDTFPDGSDAGSSKFYLTGQQLRLVLTNGGSSPVTEAVRIRVSYIPA